MSPEPTVIVLTKAPDPTRSKTRLAPLPALLRAQLAAAMIEDTLTHACAIPDARVYVAADPDPTDPYFTALASRHAIQLVDQGEGDLGERLIRLTRDFARRAPVLFLGGDCPHLNTTTLQTALARLREKDAVFAPAQDGGYVLIGLARVLPIVFQDIPWSTDAVAECTRNRAQGAGLSWAELPLHFDIDTPEDLQRLAGLPADQAPATRRILARYSPSEQRQFNFPLDPSD